MKQMSVGAYVWKTAMERPFVVRGTISNVRNEIHSRHADIESAKVAMQSVKDSFIIHAVSGEVLEIREDV